jgi:hypothetical protein
VGPSGSVTILAPLDYQSSYCVTATIYARGLAFGLGEVTTRIAGPTTSTKVHTIGPLANYTHNVLAAIHESSF